MDNNSVIDNPPIIDKTGEDKTAVDHDPAPVTLSQEIPQTPEKIFPDFPEMDRKIALDGSIPMRFISGDPNTSDEETVSDKTEGETKTRFQENDGS